MKMIKLIFLALICMTPGIIVLKTYGVSGITVLPLFWGGMFYGVYAFHGISFLQIGEQNENKN